MLTNIFFAFWFFLPAGVSGVGAIFASKFPILNKWNAPLDFGKSIGGKRIFGKNKTIRGLVFGVLASVIVASIQNHIYLSNSDIQELLKLDYTQINPIIFGTLSGFGSMMGDAIRSLFKRRQNIEPGKPWIPFDQIDFIIGGIIFTLLYVRLELTDYIIIFILYVVSHPLATITGYLLKLKDDPI
jgi:CDP-2,3-bis-(O-geranylgeranyl)-sn-glycerol synthase